MAEVSPWTSELRCRIGTRLRATPIMTVPRAGSRIASPCSSCSASRTATSIPASCSIIATRSPRGWVPRWWLVRNRPAIARPSASAFIVHRSAIKPSLGWPGLRGSRRVRGRRAVPFACSPSREPFVDRAAHWTRSATAPVPVNCARVWPVAHASFSSSGSFATRSPEMIRESVDCEMPVLSARLGADSLLAAMRARSISMPTSGAVTVAPPVRESRSQLLIQV